LKREIESPKYKQDTTERLNNTYTYSLLTKLQDNCVSNKAIQLNRLSLLLSVIKMSRITKEFITNNTKGCPVPELDLSGKKLSAVEVKELIDILPNHPNIETLSLRNTKITDEAVQHIAKMIDSNNTSINSLDLIGNQITIKGRKALRKSLKNTFKITNIQLYGIYATDKTDDVGHDIQGLTRRNSILASGGLAYFVKFNEIENDQSTLTWTYGFDKYGNVSGESKMAEIITDTLSHSGKSWIVVYGIFNGILNDDNVVDENTKNKPDNYDDLISAFRDNEKRAQLFNMKVGRINHTEQFGKVYPYLLHLVLAKSKDSVVFCDFLVQDCGASLDYLKDESNSTARMIALKSYDKATLKWAAPSLSWYVEIDNRDSSENQLRWVSDGGNDKKRIALNFSELDKMCYYLHKLVDDALTEKDKADGINTDALISAFCNEENRCSLFNTTIGDSFVLHTALKSTSPDSLTLSQLLVDKCGACVDKIINDAGHTAQMIAMESNDEAKWKWANSLSYYIEAYAEDDKDTKLRWVSDHDGKTRIQRHFNKWGDKFCDTFHKLVNNALIEGDDDTAGTETDTLISAFCNEGNRKSLFNTKIGDSFLLHCVLEPSYSYSLKLSQLLVNKCGADFNLTESCGRTARTIASGSKDDKKRRWAEELGTLFSRYKVDNKELYKSPTCIVYAAKDVKAENKRVCLKFMYHKKSFEREFKNYSLVDTEFTDDSDVQVKTPRFDSKYVLNLIQAHCRNKRPDLHLPKIVHDSDKAKVLVLVMDVGNRTLADIIAKEQIAGVDHRKVSVYLFEIASCLRHLHDKDYIHADLKKENFIRIGERIVVIDFDAMIKIGAEYTSKYTSSVIPPERARVVFSSKEDSDGNETVEGIEKQIMEIAASLANLEKSDMRKAGKKRKRRELEGKRIDLEDNLDDDEVESTINAAVVHEVWSFGIIAYELLAGLPLFKMDSNGDIADHEKSRLINWEGLNEGELNMILKKDNKSKSYVKKAKELLQNCLHPDPNQRLQSMDQILDDKYFEDYYTDEQLKAVKETIISSSERIHSEIQEQLNALNSSVKEIPNLFIQMQNIRCPYLFKIINEEKFEEFTKSKQPDESSIADDIEATLGRVQSFLDDNVKLVEDNKQLAKNSIMDRLLGAKKEYVYLQLLCGWTFKPVVTYRINLISYHENIKEIAAIGVKICTIAIAVSGVWNAATAVGRLFGYPLPKIPKHSIEKAKDFLGKMNETSLANNLRDNSPTDFNAEELDTFKKFLQTLEDEKKMCHYYDKFENHCDKSWSDFMQQEIAEQQQQITWVSKRDSKRIKKYCCPG